MVHDDVVLAVAFNSDGKYVISGSKDGSVRVWVAKTGLEITRMTSMGKVSSLAFSPDGTFIVSGRCEKYSEDNYCIQNTTRVSETETGQEIYQWLMKAMCFLLLLAQMEITLHQEVAKRRVFGLHSR